MLEALVFSVFPFCMVYAAVSDTLSMTISNRVPLIMLAAFAVVVPFVGMGWQEAGLHVAAGLLVLAVTFGLFAIGAMGGGDAKLLSATALWMGLNLHLMDYLVYSALAGGALTLAILIYRKSPLSAVTGHSVFLRNFTEQAPGVPYGIALGIGGLLAFPSSPLAAWATQRLIG